MKGRIKSLEDIPNLMGFISQTEKTGVLTLVNKGDSTMKIPKKPPDLGIIWEQVKR